MRDVTNFIDHEIIGQGTYGKVFRAKLKDGDGSLFALKKIKMENEREGFPITALREIKILKKLDHPNVLRLREIVTKKQRH